MNLVEHFDKELTQKVTQDRGETYGHPSNHFARSAAIKKVLRQAFHGDERLLHAMDMIADKLVRLCETPDHFDSWLDIAGYARTGVMVLDTYGSGSSGQADVAQKEAQFVKRYSMGEAKLVELHQVETEFGTTMKDPTSGGYDPTLHSPYERGECRATPIPPEDRSEDEYRPDYTHNQYLKKERIEHEQRRKDQDKDR